MAKQPSPKHELRIQTSLLLCEQFRNLPLSSKVLYMHLRAYHSWLCHGDYSKPVIQGDREIEKLTGMSDRTITNAKRNLIENNWIKVETGTRGASSKYWIVRYKAPVELRTQNTPEAPVEVRTQVEEKTPKKYGHYVVNSSGNGKQNKSPAHDICEMLAREPDEAEEILWWERIK